MSRCPFDRERLPAARSDRDVLAVDLMERLVVEHGPAMTAYAHQVTGDRAAAEDLVQEALLRAWQRPTDVTSDKGSLRGWLLTIVRNLAIDRHRARSSRPREVAESVSTTPLERDHADPVATRLAVREALDRIPAGHRAVLELLYFEDRSVAETSATMDLPVGTVKSRSYYALRSLRALMTEQTGLEQSTAERNVA